MMVTGDGVEGVVVDKATKEAFQDPPSLLLNPLPSQPPVATTSAPAKAEREETAATKAMRKRTALMNRLHAIESNKFTARYSSLQTPPISRNSSSTGHSNNGVSSCNGATMSSSGSSSILRREKSHWDFLLEEMQWMAIDFRQELRWKLASSSAVAKACEEVVAKKHSLVHAMTRNKSQLASETLVQNKRVSSYVHQHYHQVYNGLSQQFAAIRHRFEYGCRFYPMSMNDAIQYDSNEVYNHHDVELVIEKLLSLPSILSQHAMEETNVQEINKEIEQIVSILPMIQVHQINLIRDTLILHRLGYGALIHGPNMLGKSFSILALLSHTLSLHQSMMGSHGYAMVFVSMVRLWKWKNLLHKYWQNSWPLVVWLGDIEQQSMFAQQQSAIILVPLELSESFCDQFTSWSGTPGMILGQIVSMTVDVRSVQEITNSKESSRTSADEGWVEEDAEDDGFQYMKGTNKQRWVRNLSEFCNRQGARYRVLISEDYFPSVDRFSTLAFLVPGLTHDQLVRRFHPEAMMMMLMHANIPIEQYNKHTLNQLLFNLSVQVQLGISQKLKVESSIDERIIPVELLHTQRKKYDEIVAVLAKSGYYTGANIEDVVRIMLLLKLVCLHHALVTIHRPSSSLPPSGTSQSAANSSNGSHPNSLDILAGLSASAFLSYKPSPSKSADIDRSKGSVLFFPGRLLNQLRWPYSVSAANYDEEMLSGSSKFTLVKQFLMEDYKSIGVVILTSSYAEMLVLERFLAMEGIEHHFPQHLPDGVEDMNDLDAKALFMLLNESFYTPRIQSGGGKVWLGLHALWPVLSRFLGHVEVVISLSPDWNHIHDLRSYLRMQALASEKPISIIHIVGKNTVEEAMFEYKLPLPLLQGLKLSDLSLSSMSDNTGKNIESSLQNMMFLKNAPVLQELKSEYTSGSTSPNSSQSTIAVGKNHHSSPATASAVVDYGASAPPPRRAGGGKGMLVLGPHGTSQFVKSTTSNHGWSSCSFILSSLHGGNDEDSTSDTRNKQQAKEWMHQFRRLTRQAMTELCRLWLSEEQGILAGGEDIEKGMAGARKMTRDCFQVLFAHRVISEQRWFGTQIHSHPRLHAENLYFMYYQMQRGLQSLPSDESRSDKELCLSRQELKRLGAAGTGLSAHERGLQSLYLPVQPLSSTSWLHNNLLLMSQTVDGTASTISGVTSYAASESAESSADACQTAQLQRPTVLNRFRESWFELQRAGQLVESGLYVNPLQTAYRGEATNYGVSASSVTPDLVRIRYMMKGVALPKASMKKGGNKSQENKALSAELSGSLDPIDLAGTPVAASSSANPASITIAASSGLLATSHNRTPEETGLMDVDTKPESKRARPSKPRVRKEKNPDGAAIKAAKGSNSMQVVDSSSMEPPGNGTNSSMGPLGGLQLAAQTATDARSFVPTTANSFHPDMHGKNGSLDANGGARMMHLPYQSSSSVFKNEMQYMNSSNNFIVDDGKVMNDRISLMTKETSSYYNYSNPHDVQLSMGVSHSLSSDSRDMISGRTAMNIPSAYDSTGSSPRVFTSPLSPEIVDDDVDGDSWLAVEDDILICMQNVANDPHFVHTLYWLNHAKGIDRGSDRTSAQARKRYDYLCREGIRDRRLQDTNVIRTIAKLKKTMKQRTAQQSNHNASAPKDVNSGTGSSSNSNKTPHMTAPHLPQQGQQPPHPTAQLSQQPLLQHQQLSMPLQPQPQHIMAQLPSQGPIGPLINQQPPRAMGPAAPGRGESLRI